MKCLISWIECKEYSTMVHGFMFSFIRLHVWKSEQRMTVASRLWLSQINWSRKGNGKLGVLTTIYTGHPTGNLVHNCNRTTKFGMVGEQPAIKCIQTSRTDYREKKNCITSNHSPYFLKFPKLNGVNHLIFLLEFLVFPCTWYKVPTGNVAGNLTFRCVKKLFVSMYWSSWGTHISYNQAKSLTMRSITEKV